MKRFASFAVLAVLIGATSVPTAVGAAKSKVKVVNQSEWRIDQFFMSPSDSDDWGPDQLGDKVIAKGQTFTLTDIPCNLWDIKVVDEDGDECVLEKVDLCAEEAQWEITSEDLLSCQASS